MIHPKPWKPTRVWRTIRGVKANYKTAFYSTKERRDAAAQRDANKDGEHVLCEVWERDTYENCDPINDGWGCDKVVEPETRTLEAGEVNINLLAGLLAVVFVVGAALLIALIVTHTERTDQQKCQATYAKYGKDGGSLCNDGPQTYP